MIFHRAYYTIKPMLPVSLRLTLRRWRANSKRRAYANVWPIDEKAGAIPPGWPGWPNGKKFALVLTHDVETTCGLQKVERLMDVESQYGFRSSFNFVPERDYRVSEGLRHTMEQRGYEIGVHGLKHDEKLYTSKVDFPRKAARINEYLRQWNSCGFRSPLMHHRLGWLHQLNIEYDLSTFDTDPFEPEPDGYGTVFPFWVPGPNGSGYVELPYTLPQDHCLFVLFREQNIDIWKKKLHWVAEHGGMVLLNTHPDYMSFAGKPGEEEFPVAYYEEFLRYTREKYEGLYWSALPREVARYYRGSVPASSRNTRNRVCMLAYTDYEVDSHVRCYAETLASRGDFVEVIALREGSGHPRQINVDGITVHRIQNCESNENSKLTYASRIIHFLLAASLFLNRRQRQIRYDLIHIHNIPDFLVFAAWYPKWTGAKLILDIPDVVPELFEEKFDSKHSRFYVRLLKAIEKASAAFVDHVIISNDLWSMRLNVGSVVAEKCSIFVNQVDPSILFPHPRVGTDETTVIVFPGSFQWQQGLDLALEAIARVKNQAPNVELHLYGQGELRDLAARLNLKEIRFFQSVPLLNLPGVIATTDLGVVPKRADGFDNQAYSAKIMELMSQGVPVIVSRNKIDTFYFDDNVVRFFLSGDIQGLADAMLELIRRKDLREPLSENGRQYGARNRWDVRKQEYFDLVDSLLAQ